MFFEQHINQQSIFDVTVYLDLSIRLRRYPPSINILYIVIFNLICKNDLMKKIRFQIKRIYFQVSSLERYQKKILHIYPVFFFQ